MAEQAVVMAAGRGRLAARGTGVARRACIAGGLGSTAGACIAARGFHVAAGVSVMTPMAEPMVVAMAAARRRIAARGSGIAGSLGAAARGLGSATRVTVTAAGAEHAIEELEGIRARGAGQHQAGSKQSR